MTDKTASKALQKSNMSKYLTFGELSIGDEFIAVPENGDDQGHGGFRGAYLVYKKMDPFKTGSWSIPEHSYNAIHSSSVTLTNISDSMQIIKVRS